MLSGSLLTVVSLLTVIPFYITLAAELPASDGPFLSFTAEHEFHLMDVNVNNEPLPKPILSALQPTGTASRTTFALKTRPTAIIRPHSLQVLQQARLRSLHYGQSQRIEWDEIDILGPDIEDRHTLAQLARMTGNAYALPGQKNWYDVDPAWNTSFPYGWEDHTDGFRGHVFLSSDNSTVILSIKGTTLQGPTSKKDKFNDNLLFSCCCARVDISWIFRTVCNCYARKWRCDNTCLKDALVEDSLFYSVGVNLVNDLIYLYPTSTVWLVGHSLGGALASLLGSTFGLPAVAFESPGERLAATRLHLPLPASSSLSPVTHVYHTADPIPQGTCTGITSACAQGGYALETRCHLGKTILYDTVGQLGWKVDVRKHVIRDLITKVLEYEGEDGEGWEWEDGREVPEAREEVDCMDCFKWEFGEYKNHDDVFLP